MDQRLIDLGASSHMMKDLEILVDYRRFDKPVTAALGDGHIVETLGSGNVHTNMFFCRKKVKKSWGEKSAVRAQTCL